jgi:hypothetical protein
MPEAGRLQRAAQKPASVTKRKKRQKTSSAVVCNEQDSHEDLETDER